MENGVKISFACDKDVFTDAQSSGDIQKPSRDTDPAFTVHTVEEARTTFAAEPAFCRLGRDISFKSGILGEVQVIERCMCRGPKMHARPAALTAMADDDGLPNLFHLEGQRAAFTTARQHFNPPGHRQASFS